MKQLLVLFMLCFLAIAGHAQINRDLWFKGVVELEEGGLIEGNLSYYSDFKNAILQIRTGGKTLSFDANQIVSFRFFDDQLGVTRRFYSLPYSPKDGRHQVMLFFEALLEGGHVSALSKIEFRVESRQVQNPYMYRGYFIPSWYNRGNTRSYTVEVPYETIFLVSPDTDIKPYSMPTSLAHREVRFRKPDSEVLMELVRDRRAQIDSFIEKQKLDLRRRNDLLQVIQYYNQLKDRNP
jgi:hypothetical protein